MKLLKTKVLSLLVFVMTLCIGLQTDITEVRADAQPTTQQGVVLKSTNISTDKTIIVPRKEPVVTYSSNGSSSSTSYSRGFSGGSAIASGAASSVVSKSFEFLGRPYVYGAAGPKAFDCSGFTAYVYGAFGVTLPHYSVSQSEMGQAVSRSNLQPGDLVFFNTAGYISHVGMYIGDDQFIHASSGSQKVTISELSSSYYSTRYVGARRILK